MTCFVFWILCAYNLANITFVFAYREQLKSLARIKNKAKGEKGIEKGTMGLRGQVKIMIVIDIDVEAMIEIEVETEIAKVVIEAENATGSIRSRISNVFTGPCIFL